MLIHAQMAGRQAVFLYRFVGLWQTSLCLCPLIFNGDPGHKSQSVGLQDHSTCDSRANTCVNSFKILCTLRMCSGSEMKPTAKEGVGRTFINCTLRNSLTPTYLKPGLLAYLRSFHCLGNSSTPPTQGSKYFQNWYISKHVTERTIRGKTEGTRRWERRCQQLLDDLKRKQ